jgi:hypothetical protein
MNHSARLERRYRRLLACYPRAFRRENEDEILAVLLACAQDGKQRPGLAASADLIKGAIRMRLRMAGRPPRTVRAVIRLICAAAAAELAVLITVIATAGSVRSAVARRYPGLPVIQHAVNVNLVIDYISASLGIAVWLVLIWTLVRGSGRARIVLAANLGTMSLSMLIAISQGAAAYAPADLIAGAAEWLITLAATVLLFTGTSSRYYRPEPRPRAPVARDLRDHVAEPGLASQPGSDPALCYG